MSSRFALHLQNTILKSVWGPSRETGRWKWWEQLPTDSWDESERVRIRESSRLQDAMVRAQERGEQVVRTERGEAARQGSKEHCVQRTHTLPDRYLPVIYLGISWEVPSGPAFQPPFFLNMVLEEDCSFTSDSGGKWGLILICHCREVPEWSSSTFSKTKRKGIHHPYKR